MSQWYFQDSEGALAGPVDEREFLQRRASGVIADDTRIWRTGWKDWANYSDLQALGVVPVPTPPAESYPTPPPFLQKPRTPNPPPAQDSTVPALKLEDLRLDIPQPQEIKRVKCSVCGEEWADNLVWKSGHTVVCAPCIQIHEHRQQQKQLRKLPNGVGSSGIGGWIPRLILVGLIIGAIVVAAFWKKSREAQLRIQPDAPLIVR